MRCIALRDTDWPADMAFAAVCCCCQVVVVASTFYVDPNTNYYEVTKATVCAPFEAASAKGIVVVAAAGNSQTSMRGYFPASKQAMVAAGTALIRVLQRLAALTHQCCGS